MVHHILKTALLSAGIAVFCFPQTVQASFFGLFGGPGEDDFVQISNELSPVVETAFMQDGKDLNLTVRTVNPWGGKVTGELTAQRTRTKRFELTKFPAEVDLKESELGTGYLKLRLVVTWYNANGKSRLQETYFSNRTGNMNVFDIESHFNFIKDRKSRIMIPFEMEQPGKATVVIRDANGKHVRNLRNGIFYEAGKHLIEWDGRTETGNLAAPGKFTVHIMTHPGLEYEFKMMYDNGDEQMFTPWGSNHGTMHAFAENGKYIFAAAALTEGGNAIVALTPEGKFVKAFNQQMGTGIGSVRIMADEQNLYAIHGGGFWGGAKQRRITFSAWDVETARPVNVNRKGFHVLYETTETLDQPLAGAAMYQGMIYIANRITKEVSVLDPATAQITKKFPCPVPGELSSFDKALYLAHESGVYKLDGEKWVKLFALNYPVKGFHAVKQGFFVSGAPDSTVKLYDQTGKVIDVIGTPGGDYAGKWQSQRLVNPTGLLLTADGKSFWTAEQRSNPKRLTRWSYPEKKILYEKFGSPAYGSPSCGFDPDDETAWYGQGVEWKVDLVRKTAKPAYVQMARGNGMFGENSIPRGLRVIRHQGRTYIAGCGGLSCFGVLAIHEQMKDHSLKLRMLASSVHHISRQLKTGNPAREILFKELDAFYPDFASDRKRVSNRAFMIWTDKNGNEQFDSGEFQFTKGVFPAGYWGLQISELEFSTSCLMPDNSVRVVTMKPSIDKNGLLQYDLNKAVENGITVKDPLPPGNGWLGDEGFSFCSGLSVNNSNPYMLGLRNDGTLQWVLQNKWTNVHGSHNAPMPSPGEMQGVLFCLGSGINAAGTEIFALMGNHGRIFFLTSDGFYIDELFTDCRVSAAANETLIGGESFGGFFGKSNQSGKFYLQGGSSGFRIYEIKNLDRMKRTEYKLDLSLEQIEKAAKNNPAADKTAEEKKAVIPYLKLWKGQHVSFHQFRRTAGWNKGGHINVHAMYNDDNLYLRYDVQDSSPWVNNGKLWSQLFKTGDSVDFQLASDPNAKVKRSQPVLGDIRLLIAPFEGKNIAVLYRYKAKGGKLNPMDFPSPWRSFKVEDVRRLDKVQIEVKKMPASYSLYATIPWSELGIDIKTLKEKTLRGDFGVIFGDQDGTINLLRSYWSNQDTGLVNDVPGEMIPVPKNWSAIKFGK